MRKTQLRQLKQPVRLSKPTADKIKTWHDDRKKSKANVSDTEDEIEDEEDDDSSSEEK
jgi:hypothetical protein